VTAINYGTRARLGMILPSGNQAAEPQFQAILPAGVSLHTTRLKLTGSSEADLLAMTERVEDAAELVADAQTDLVLFHCTAVSTFSTELEASILERVRKASGRPATATSEAITLALRQFGARRIVMLSPYPDAINRREEVYFRGAGFEILASAGLDCADANAMMAVSPEAWIRMASEHRDDRADAYLLSCTTVRTTDVIEQLEAVLDRPVVTSNTAAIWHCLRTLGIHEPIEGFGRLLSSPR
jgi:maleate isomerase